MYHTFIKWFANSKLEKTTIGNYSLNKKKQEKKLSVSEKRINFRIREKFFQVEIFL
ncbi:hypothetical protein PGB90_004185 [Kerria lacca]